MTKEEYLAAAEARYDELQALNEKHPLSFYDYEVAFANIWKDLGREVLEQSISTPPADRRKKKEH